MIVDKDKSNAQTNSVKGEAMIQQPETTATENLEVIVALTASENKEQSMRFKHYEERARRMKNIKK